MSGTRERLFLFVEVEVDYIGAPQPLPFGIEGFLRTHTYARGE
jgi:hypothetical protein